MSSPATALTGSMMFQQIAEGAQPAQVRVKLTYATHHPYAVELSFRTGEATSVEWEISRELLADGLTAPAGIAGIQIHPNVEPNSTTPAQAVVLKLNNSHGRAMFVVNAVPLRAFLNRTNRLVPPGDESAIAQAELDDVLRQLLETEAGRG